MNMKILTVCKLYWGSQKFLLFVRFPLICKIKHHLIFFTLKRAFLLKMKAADGFASIPYPEVGKFTLSYSTFQVIVFKLPLRGGVYWG